MLDDALEIMLGGCIAIRDSVCWSWAGGNGVSRSKRCYLLLWALRWIEFCLQIDAGAKALAVAFHEDCFE